MATEFLTANDEWEDGAIIDYTTGEIATPIDTRVA